MHRQPLLNLLRQHHPADAGEQTMIQATIAFVEQYPACFERTLLIGHVTGSAWVISPDRQQTLLIHHRKLGRWLQPGGHADGDPDVAAVALREAQEETGLTSLRPLCAADGQSPVFDVDIHPIPARGDVPAHLHYDIRFLVEADPNEPFCISAEINTIDWVSLKTLHAYTDSASILRMGQKIVKN